MTIKIIYTKDDATELASIGFGFNDARMNRILDAYREQRTVGDEAPMGRPAAAKAMAREWIKDIRMRGWNHEAGKVAKAAVDALGTDTEPTEV
jgi:hypothetical protein